MTLELFLPASLQDIQNGITSPNSSWRVQDVPSHKFHPNISLHIAVSHATELLKSTISQAVIVTCHACYSPDYQKTIIIMLEVLNIINEGYWPHI